MTRVATLEALITANTTGFTSGLTAAQGKLGGFKTGLAGVAKGLTGMDVSTLGAAAAVGALAAGLKYSIAQAAESEAVMAQTEAVIKSTGSAAGLTAAQIGDMSLALSQQSTFSDEAIQKGQNLLLTFTNIGSTVFPAATQAMVDMATAMGTDASSGAIQLGKALQDPVGGIAALTRVGVNFTAAQKELIKSMVATGDVAGAQKIIIAELNKEFGGSAQAALGTYAGKMTQLKNNVDNLAEAFGNELIPILSEAAGAMSLLMTRSDQLHAILATHETDVLATAGSYEEYVAEVIRARIASGEYVDVATHASTVQGKLVASTGIMSKATYIATKGLEGLTEGARFSQRAIAALAHETRGGAGLPELAGKAAVAADAMIKTGRAAGGLRDSLEFAYDAGMLLEMGLSGDLLAATEDYNKTMAETTQAIDEYHAAMAEGGKAAEEAAGTLEGLIAQQGLAEDALRKATAEIVLQQVAMNLGAEGALEFAHATGIMSDADYELAKSIQRATEAADLNRDGEINSQAERARLLDLTLKLTDKTGDLATGTETATTNMGLFDESLSPVEAGLKDTGLAADGATSDINFIPKSVAVDTTPAMASLDNARTSAYNFHTALDNIPRNISVAIHTAYTGEGISVGGVFVVPGSAHGADFVVPPGFPHDSYPMRVQSGEHVTVTPAGQQPRASGGDTYNVTINDRLAAALFKEQVRQRSLARAEALM